MKTEGCPKQRVVCVRESHFEIDKRKRDKIAEIRLPLPERSLLSKNT